MSRPFTKCYRCREQAETIKTINNVETQSKLSENTKTVANWSSNIQDQLDLVENFSDRVEKFKNIEYF